jgi:hypothetical protein
MNICHAGSLEHLPTYNSWLAMHYRCSHERNGAYHKYGAKGIKVCDRWSSFRNFLEDMGKRPEGTSLDRLDRDADYEPTNCRWATMAQRSANRKFKDGRWLKKPHPEKSVAELASEAGVNVNTVFTRLRNGVPLADALKPGRYRRPSIRAA